MANNSKIRQIYTTLKGGGADVGTEQEFSGWFFAKGEQGYKNRKQVYDTLKGGGADVGVNYEEFRDWLGLHAVAQPKQSITDRRMRGVEELKQGAQNIIESNKKRNDNIRKYYSKNPYNQSLLDIGGTKQQGALHGKSAVTDMQYNPNSGRFERKYITEMGNEYSNKIEADYEQQRIDDVTNARLHPEEYTKRQVYNLDNEIDNAIAQHNQEKERREKQIRDTNLKEILNQKGWEYIGQGKGTNLAIGGSDDVRQTLVAAKYAMDEAKSIINEAESHAKDGTLSDWMDRNIMKGAGRLNDVKAEIASNWRGQANTLFDARTWLATLSLNDVKAITAALDAADKGKQTKEQQMLLDAEATKLAANAVFGSKMGYLYKVGQTTAESLPFMLEMAINPASATGKGLAARFTRYALKKYGKAAIKAAPKAFKAAKVGVRAAGDILGAATMTATTGMPRTQVDTQNRMNGEIEYDHDAHGNIIYGGHTIGESTPAAFAKAFGAQTIENWSEMVGEYFNPILKAIGKPIGKGVGKGIGKAAKVVGLKDVDNYIKGIASGKLGKLGNAVVDFEKHAQWHGPIGEYFEEVVGNLTNALTVGDMTLDTAEDTGVFNKEVNLQTLLSVGQMGGFMSAVKTIGYKTPKKRLAQDMQEADERAAKMWGGAAVWNKFRNTISFGNEDDIVEAFNQLGRSKYATEESKRAALDYATAVMKYKGYLQGEEAKKNDTETATLEKSFEDGYNAQQEDNMRQIKKAVDGYKTRLSDFVADEMMQQFDEDPLAALHTINNSKAWTDEEKQLALDYVNLNQAYQGMLQRVRDDIDERVNENNKLIDAKVNREDLGGDGKIHPVTLKGGQEVYITSGRVVALDDGSIDRENSDNDLTYIDKQGRVGFISADRIAGVGEVVDTETEKQTTSEEIRETMATEIAATIDSEGDAYKLDDNIVLHTDNGEVNATVIGEENEDGLIEVETDTPINGKKVNLFTRDKLDELTRKEQGDENTSDEEDSENFDTNQTNNQENADDVLVERLSNHAPERAQGFINNNIESLNKELAKAKKKTSKATDIDQYERETAENEAEVQRLEAELERWNTIQQRVNDIANEKKAAALAEQKTKDKQLHDEAVRAEEEQQQASAEARDQRKQSVANTQGDSSEEVSNSNESNEGNVEAEQSLMESSVENGTTTEYKEYERDNAEGTINKQGGLTKNELSDSILSESWRGALHVLGRNIGRRIVILSGEDTRERFGNGVQGFYDKSNNTLYLNEDYVKDNENLRNFVLGHEMTHILKSENPEVWNAFVGTVKAAMGEDFQKEFDKKCKRYDSFIEKYNKKHKRKLHKLSDAEIEEEVCSDWAGRNVLTDEESVKKIIADAEKAGADPVSLTKRILDAINQFLAQLKQAFKNAVGETDEIADNIKFAEQAKKLWQDMYNVAVARQNQLKESVETEMKGSEVDAKKGDVRFAVADILEGEALDKAVKDLIAVTGRSEKVVRRWLKAEQSLAKIINDNDNKALLDLEVDESVPAIWNNSDYPQGTVEFSNICRKRLPLTLIYQRLQKEYPNTVFDAATLEIIRGALKDKGIDVACGICFVEDRRQLLGEIGKDFINAVQGKQRKAEGGNEKQQKAIDRLKESGDNYVPTLYELLTLDGMKQLRREHPSVAQAFVEFNNARGMQAGRLFEAYSAYHRDILKWNKNKVNAVNSNGGLRIFSFSDFEAHHLIDLVQVLTDCASKGVMVQGYTKVPEFAKSVMNTKMKLNRSLIAKGEGYVDADYNPKDNEAVSPNVINGKRLLLDCVEGIDVNHPDFFDSSRNHDVGNILVGINDEQIRMAMADPFIDYIIPFHSGLSESIRKQKGIGTWKNYKLSQLEKMHNENGKLVNADKHGINIYTDVLPRGEQLIGREIRNRRDFQEAFFAACAEKGWVPRFADFINKNKKGEYVYTPGYEKLLIDFKLFDNNGKIIMQEPVVPVFDEAFNAKILDDYVKDEKAKTYESMEEAYNDIVERLGLSSTPEEEEEDTKFSLADEEKREERRDSEESKALFETAKKRFGTTLDIREAGYVLPDGSMLDFSGRHSLDSGMDASYLRGGRRVDHREVANVLNYKEDGNTPSGITTSMSDFIERGAIRIDSNFGTINLFMKPTSKQKGVLRQLIAKNEDYVSVDFGNGDNSEHYVEYEDTRPLRVLSAIDKYYDEGIKPESNVSFSLADEKPFYSNAQRAVEGIKQEKATPEQWLKMIEKAGGLKAGEDKWMGLSDFLMSEHDKKTLTKDEVLDFIRENMIQIEEVEYYMSADEINERREQLEEQWNEDYPEIYVQIDIETREQFGVDDMPLHLWESYAIGDADERELAKRAANYYQRNMEDIFTDDEDEDDNIQDIIDEFLSDMDDAFEKNEEEIKRKYFAGENGIISSNPINSTPINSTRLSYTTQGLENKREIALTVPTIESWNEDDEIHFGDAGEGRAVAWVRFGDTTDEDGNKVLVIDEIQSKRHQEGRERGYLDNSVYKKLYDNYNELGKELIGFRKSLHEKYPEIAYHEMGDLSKIKDYITTEEYDKIQQLSKEESAAGSALVEYSESHIIPAAPFEKNWHELAMKRMLRYAAENGYDKVAWTTGEQQAERYNLEKVVDKIEATDSYNDGVKHVTLRLKGDWHIEDFGVDKKTGEVLGGQYEGRKLQDVVGKEAAEKILSDGDVTLEGDGLKFGGEGMKGFYDKMLPSFMNKYGKKWGVKVGEVTLPNVEESARKMWSVDVTPEMKESVMQGQPMFLRGGAVQLTPQEVALRDAIVDLMDSYGQRVITDDVMGQSVIDYVNGDNIREMRVYHGSGADFDAFDHSHMGEGEGAQAYGWGSYVTEVEGIGRTYAEESAGEATYQGVKIDSKDPYSDNPAERALFYMEQEHGRKRAIKFLKELIRNEEDIDTIKDYKETINVLQDEKNWDEPKRYLYSVEIPDEAGVYYISYKDRMSDQNNILEAVDNALAAQGWKRQEIDDRIRFTNGDKQIILTPNQSGADLYAEIEEGLGSPEEASKFLHDEAGITGIKYPAQHRSGGREDGASNYVIFDENDLKITDKAKFFRTPEGEVYGFTYKGDIYIDPRVATAETPIHEYAHLWVGALKKANPKAWETLKNRMEGMSDVMEYVKGLYPELEGDDLLEEVFTHYSGKRGVERLREEQKAQTDAAEGIFNKASVIAMFEKLRGLLKDFWNKARDLFAGKVEGVEDMSGEDFADMMLGDLLGGFKPDGGGDKAKYSVKKSSYNHSSVYKAFITKIPDDIIISKNVSRSTSSKYITLDYGQAQFDIRFANHSTWSNSGDPDVKSRIEVGDNNKINSVDIHMDETEGNTSQLIQFINWVKEWNSTDHDNMPTEEDIIYLSAVNPMFKVLDPQAIIAKNYFIEVDGVHQKVSALERKKEEWEKDIISEDEERQLYKELPYIDDPKYIEEERELVNQFEHDIIDAKAQQDQILRERESRKDNNFGSKVFGRLEDSIRRNTSYIEKYKPIISEYDKVKDTKEYKEALKKREQIIKILDAYHYAKREIEYINRDIQALRSSIRYKDYLYLKDTAYLNTLNDERIREYAKRLSKISKKIENQKVGDGENLYRDGDNTPYMDYEEKLKDSRRRGYTKQQLDRSIERHVRLMRERAEETVGKLGIADNVTILEDNTGLEGRKAKAKGWYDTESGKIVVVLGNHGGVSDVVKTILHEGVAHYGLRQLFGENFNTFLDNVYKHGSEEVKQRIDELAKKYDGNIRTATEEYLAELAESTDFERPDLQSWWRQIKRWFLDMLHSVGLKDFNAELSDNELRYILWRSYENLAEPNRYNNVFATAKDIAKQYELGVGNFAAESMVSEEEQEQSENKILFRDDNFSPRDRQTARDVYNDIVASGRFQFQEAMQDSMLGLKELYNAILGKGTKIEDVAGNENAYLAENRMSSVNTAEQHLYFTQVMSPLLKAVYELVGEDGAARKELTDYMMAKHGLERNQKFAERDALEAKTKGKDYNGELQKNRKRDYAGLTALTGMDDVRDAEAEAQRIVDDYESLHDTTVLWQRVKDATQTTLAKLYKGGIFGKNEYDNIRQMFDYYIPLRGWDEKTSDEVYGYLTSRNGFGGSIAKKAKGRSSKADDPIATIAFMADAAIRQANRNLMKQRFLTFVQNNPSDLVSVNKLWLKYDDVSDTWEPVFADIKDTDTAEEVERKVEEFEERMQQLAQSEPDKYKHGKDAANIPYKVVKGNEREHQVLVKRNGETYVLTINGNPRAAQALNGLTNPDVDIDGVAGKILKAGEWVNRQMSAAYTTRNPDFIVSNFFRDMLYSNCMTWVKESPKYARRFHMNFALVNPTRMLGLYAKWEMGKLDDNDKIEKLFGQFMANGGETGFTNIKDIEGHKKDIAKELKRQGSEVRKAANVIGEALDVVNRSVENTARFAAFITSREMGRSIDRCIYDAKEVSVNFNKKGSGSRMLGTEGQDRNIIKLAVNPKTYFNEKDRTELIAQTGSYISGAGRLGFVFWNAGIQGLTNISRAAKYNKTKAAVGATMMFALGALMPYAAMLMAGGDDDDKNAYYNLPEYVRRSNICINAGDAWITIPLPIEYRAIYGLGELAYGVLSGHERYSDGELAKQILSQVSQLLPIDFMEGGGGLMAFVPSAIKPIVEVHNNKSWSGLPIYRKSEFNENDPEAEKVYSNTNKYLVAVSKWLNELGGGDDVRKSKLDLLNPAQLEYILRGYFGGYFEMPNKLIKMAETTFGDREFEWKNMLIANRLVKSGDERTEGRKLREEYYKYKDEYEKTKHDLKGYEEKADNEDFKRKLGVLKHGERGLKYEVFDSYRPLFDAYHDARKDVREDVRREIEKEEMLLQREMVDLMHAIEDDKNPDIDKSVDDMLKREFEYGGIPQKSAANTIAKRMGGRDTYGNPKSGYAQTYYWLRDYTDLAQDVALQAEEQKAKESGDTDRAKRIAAARREVTSIKKDLAELPFTLDDGTEVTTDDVMKELREVRSRYLEEFGITRKQIKKR